MNLAKKQRYLIGLLKDKVSLIKTTLSTRRRASFTRRAILWTTTHSASSAPSEERIAAVLSTGTDSLTSACTCIQALMDRLHSTHNAFVALKCLYIIHNIITRGPINLKDQLSIYPSSGGRNFLNLSNFNDGSGPETRELSSWAIWYASVLEQNLTASRVLGHYLSSSNKQEKVLASLNSDFLREVDALVGFVQEISNVPESLHLQRNDLVYEIVRMVGVDYRLIQREIYNRVVEFGKRIVSVSLDELILFMSALQKLEGCREKLIPLFANRMRNDALWDLINEVKTKIETTVSKKAGVKALVRRDDKSRELGQSFRLISCGSLLRLDRVSSTVSIVR